MTDWNDGLAKRPRQSRSASVPTYTDSPWVIPAQQDRAAWTQYLADLDKRLNPRYSFDYQFSVNKDPHE